MYLMNDFQALSNFEAQYQWQFLLMAQPLRLCFGSNGSSLVLVSGEDILKIYLKYLSGIRTGVALGVEEVLR